MTTSADSSDDSGYKGSERKGKYKTEQVCSKSAISMWLPDFLLRVALAEHLTERVADHCQDTVMQLNKSAHHRNPL